MATTSDGIWTPDSVDTFALVNDLAAMAASIQAALIHRANSYIGTSEGRIAFTATALEGTLWSDTNGDKILWIKQGASWRRVWPEVTVDPVVGVGDWSGSLPSSTTHTVLPLTLAPGSVGLTVSDGGLVVSRDGWYAVTGVLWTAGSGDGNRSSNVYVNGSSSAIGSLWKPPSVNSTQLPASGLLLLSAGDVLTLRGWQSSGSTLSASGRLSLNLVN